MNEYIDKDIVAVNGVLLQYGVYSSPEMLRRDEIRIDADMGDMSIRRIGDGAVMGNHEVHKVVIGEGIQELGDSSFAGHRNIDCVILPESLNKCGEKVFYGSEVDRLEMRRSLSRETYDRLCRESLDAGSGKKLLRKDYGNDPGMGDIELLYKLLRSSEQKLHTAELNEKMHCLFLTQSGYRPQGLKVSVFPLEGREALGEEVYIKKMLLKGENGLVLDESEAEYQQSLTERVGVDIEKFRYGRLDSGLISFDDKDTVFKDDGRVSALLVYESGWVFWHTSIPVRYQGKIYHIVRRSYLVSMDRNRAMTLDHGVYDENGKACSEEMKKTIFGKYRFLSLLS